MALRVEEVGPGHGVVAVEAVVTGVAATEAEWAVVTLREVGEGAAEVAKSSPFKVKIRGFIRFE